jgi:hypothetical protein
MIPVSIRDLFSGGNLIPQGLSTKLEKAGASSYVGINSL